MFILGLDNAAVAGAVVSCQSNIVYAASGTGNGYAVRETGSTFVLDAVTLAGHNAFYNANTGSCKYNAGASSATITGYVNLEVTNATAFASQGGGAGNTQIQTGYDFTANPTFVDAARNLAKWGGTTAGGGTATYTAALATLVANPSLLTQATTGLVPYVLAGYVPTNAAFLNTTYSGDSLTTDAAGNPLNGTVGPLGYPSSAATATPGSILLCV